MGRTSECTLRSLKDIYTECDVSPQVLIQLMLYVTASEWPRGLRRGSATARLPELRVRIPSGTWMFFCFECCVLSGIGLCDGLIPCPEMFYECLSVVCVVCCQVEVSATGRSLAQRILTERGVSVCDPQILSMRRPRPLNLSIN